VIEKGIYKSKKDLVVDALREAILSGELEPGERLLQEDLAERLKMSSTPVREALRQLESEGILQSSPNRGVRVAEVDLRSVHEVYMIRATLEALATRMAVPKLRPAHLDHLRILHARIEDLIKQKELKELRRLNYELHILIYETADMPELLKIIRSLWTKFPWDTLNVLPDRAGVSAAEHADLINALAAGDAELAGQLMHAHIESGARELDSYLASVKAAEDAATDTPLE
jgi:DNA-binding GntR family transcriptional regulator